MEPEGITRACPMVPLMSKNTSATQNQAMTSRCTRCPTGTLGCASFLGLGSAFMFHRHGMFDWSFTSVAVHRVTCSVHNAFAHPVALGPLDRFQCSRTCNSGPSCRSPLVLTRQAKGSPANQLGCICRFLPGCSRRR